MSNVGINKNIVNINGNDLIFKYDIAQMIPIKDLMIIRLNIPTSSSIKIEDLNNIYCVDNKAQIRWQIKNLTARANPEYKISPIVLLNYTNNILQATDFMGRRYVINIETGEMYIKDVLK
ncbi:hypothetical protein [Streptococcus fryi]